jgi:hypothetical protein
MWWWDEREEKLPANAGEVHKSVHGTDIDDISILILGWMQHAGCNKLRVPGGLLLILDFLQELSKDLLLLLALSISDNINNLEGLL